MDLFFQYCCLLLCLLAIPTERLAVVSPSAAAFTLSSDDLAVEDDATDMDPVCDTPGCVLAGKNRNTTLFTICPMFVPLFLFSLLMYFPCFFRLGVARLAIMFDRPRRIRK